MIVLGITGGIASGKTTICNFLKKQKLPIHDSDLVVRKIYKKPPPALLSTLNKIGLSHSIKDKKINKNIIRDEVFKNPTIKKKLEKQESENIKNPITGEILIKTQLHY